VTLYGTSILFNVGAGHPVPTKGSGAGLRCNEGGPWGEVRTDQCSLWSTEREYWSKPDGTSTDNQVGT